MRQEITFRIYRETGIKITNVWLYQFPAFIYAASKVEWKKCHINKF